MKAFRQIIALLLIVAQLFAQPMLAYGCLASAAGADCAGVAPRDELGRVVARTIDGAANASTVHYDDLGRVDQTVNPLGAFALHYVGLTGRLESVELPNGQETRFTYWATAPPAGAPGNGAQRLKRIQSLGVPVNGVAQVLAQHDFEYSAAGQIAVWQKASLSIGAEAAEAQKWTAAYDRLGQITGATLSDLATGQTLKNVAYAYDDAGNRTLAQEDLTARKSLFNGLNQLVSRRWQPNACDSARSGDAQSTQHTRPRWNNRLSTVGRRRNSGTSCESR